MTTQEEPDAKKRKISTEEFRSNLSGDYKISYLEHFLKLCVQKDHKSISEYFEKGGSCMELLQIIDNNPNVPPILILEITYYLLLEIIARYPHLHASGREACSHILTQHVTMINKMLGLNSRTVERKVVLKLLTAIVSFSANLAKDVLIHVNFNPTNIQMLVKHSDDNDSVRKAFVNFLSALLVDGHQPTIVALLSKPGLLTSIVNGLIYDPADSVVVILTAMKNHILENTLVTKTMKMKVFNTFVIRDIVNLYNWKGSKGINSKKVNSTPDVDQLQKSTVSDCVHNFLLILCTTKHGVIFRDPLMGTGKSVQNNLILTVIQGLERPWEHSYAGELVVKMCGACPDITRVIWSNLKESLTPRDAKNWFKAIEFAKNLIVELTPDKIEYAVKNLSTPDLVRVTKTLVAPASAVKAVNFDSSDTLTFEVKSNVYKFLLVMLVALENYLDAMRKWLNEKNYLVYKNNLDEYISSIFPPINHILEFEKLVGNEEKVHNVNLTINYLNLIVDILNQYSKLSPQLLDDLQIINVKNLLEFLNNISDVDNALVEQMYKVRTKIVNLFLKSDPTAFYPGSELFSETLSILLEAYHYLKDPKTYEILFSFLVNTTIFESSEYEINVWINAIFNSKAFTKDLRNFITSVLSLASSNSLEYISKISGIKKELQQQVFDLKKILDNLNEEVYLENNIKHTNLSHVIYALIEYLGKVEVTKSIKSYVAYLLINLLHRQTNPEILLNILKHNNGINIPKNILDYLLNFEDNTMGNILRINKSNLGYLSKLSQTFLESEFNNEFFVDLFEEIDKNETSETVIEILKEDILHMLIFNLINVAEKNILTSRHTDNLLRYVKYLNYEEKYLELILNNPNFLDNFSLLKIAKETTDKTEGKQLLITNFTVGLIRNTKGNFEYILRSHASKIFSDTSKIIKKSKYKNLSHEKLLEVLESFNLSQEQCFELLQQITQINLNDFIVDSKNLSVIYYLTTYALNQLFLQSKNYENHDKYILNSYDVQYLIDALNYVISNSNVDTTLFLKSFINYLKHFPHLNSKDLKNKDLFLTLLTKKECSNDTSSLICLFLKRNEELINVVIENVEKINFTKNIIIPILDVCIEKEIYRKSWKAVYEKFEPILLKALEKPQKAGAYFEKHFVSIGDVMKLCFDVEHCKNFLRKIHKFEVSEPFLSYLLKVILYIWLRKKDKTYNNNEINNLILTYVHLILNLFKRKQFDKLPDIVKYFEEALDDLFMITKDVNFNQTTSNENFKLFIKFSLKFGISGQHCLLNLLSGMVKNINFPQPDLREMLEMLTSHSEFLDKILEDGGNTKTGLLGLMYEIFKKSDELLERNYVPLMLAAYRATASKTDRIILALLKIFEANPGKTYFYDFKPFLWGGAAANHYSVKSDIQKSLWRQPKTGTVLDLLDMDIVLNTIKNFPLELELGNDQFVFETPVIGMVYDVSFLLPLFTLLLSPENVVQTYRFTKSGALSLTVLSLSSEDKSVRGAACFVLSRFYSHLESRQSGKDNLLWLRFVEAVCKGVVLFEDFEVNNFVSIFLARMALVLTNPNHVMYGPLSQYLTAKSVLDFKTIPELYTLLHSSDVNYKEHKKFILEVILDGMRTSHDFQAALRSVFFKLIMEHYNSYISDREIKVLILQILEKTTKIKYGVKLLCNDYGLLSWLNHVVLSLNFSQNNDLLSIVIDIVSNIVSFYTHYAQAHEILTYIIDNVHLLKEENLLKLLKMLWTYNSTQFDITENNLRKLINTVGSKECLYLLDYKHCDIESVSEDDLSSYMRRVTAKWILQNKF